MNRLGVAVAVLLSASPAFAQTPELYEARRCLGLLSQSGVSAQAEALDVGTIPLCDCFGRYAGAAYANGEPTIAQLAAARSVAGRICVRQAITESISRLMWEMSR